jgi:ABC-type multidrug transport system permease subunit
MKGNWWKITKLELKLAARDREAVIWSLIAPVVMAWLFGNMFDSAPPGPTTVSVTRGDNPAYVGEIVSGMLAAEGLVVVDSLAGAEVILPDSLVAHLLGGEKVEITVNKLGASDTRARAVSVKARQTMYTLAFAAKKSWIESPPSQADVGSLVASRGPMLLESKTLGKAPKTVDGVEHQLPAMLVMFLMFQLMTFFMVLWVEDVKSGKIKRIVMSPTPLRDVFYAQLASRFLWGLLQVVIILGVGSRILGVRLEIPWGYFAAMLFVYMVAAIALGMFLATFFRTTEKANAVGVIAGLVMAALGGCWWPLEFVSATMKHVAMVFPTGLMMDAMGDFIALGTDAAFPRFNFMVLALMALVLMPLAIRRMHRQIVT